MRKILIFISMAVLSLSCSKESISPSFIPEAIPTQSFNFNVNIENLEVEEFGLDIAEVPVVGNIFQRLAGMFADISIDDVNGADVPVDSVEFNFPELAEFNLDYVKEVNLNKVHLRLANDDIDEIDLTFIKKIEVFINVKSDEVPEGIKVLALTYIKNRDKLSCFSKCFDMRSEDVDWREILKMGHQFTLETKLSVDSVPKIKLSLGGNVSFNVKLNLNL